MTTVDEAREALDSMIDWRHVEAAEGDAAVDTLIAAVRAEYPPSDALRAHWGEGYRQGRAESAQELTALREMLATRYECAVCHHWLMWRNWPNHITAYHDHYPVLTRREARPRSEKVEPPTCGHEMKLAKSYCAMPAGHKDTHRTYSAVMARAERFAVRSRAA